jgi:5'-nucleotidase
MTRLHQHRIARRTAAALSAGVALLAIAAIAPVSANAAVTCDQTISGPNAGVITVAAPDTLCLLNAVQDGAVNVDPGAGLSVISSTITGAVTLNDYSEFEFCDSSTVLGEISATGGQTAAVIGGPSCAANTIDGAVTLDSNLAGVTLMGNSIGGAVVANANLVGTTISDNGIGGALTCTANAPAPGNGGVSNTVGGGRFGQTCSSITF